MRTVEEKAKAQTELCKEKGWPRFAPRNGVCWSCGSQIYDRISMEKASNTHITGCPACHTSYCA